MTYPNVPPGTLVHWGTENLPRPEGNGYWRIAGWRETRPGIPHRVMKRYVRNFDAVNPAARQVVPYHNEIGMGTGTIQAAKGCTYHCGYCAASYREAPYRERSVESMKAAFAEVVNETGCAEVSPLILEFGTYSQKKKLMKETMEE